MMETNAKTTVGNSASREAIFSSIRKSLKKSEPFDAVHREHRDHSGQNTAVASAVPLQYSAKAVVENFCNALALLGANCIVVPSESEAAAAVQAIIRKLEAKKVAVSDSELVGRVTDTDFEADLIKSASKAELFHCDLGITSAQWAIAETGTLVLESRVESHRLTSLVPPVHLCLVAASGIRQTLGEILELTHRDLGPLVTFITGASRTSDIELTLAIGVHGPGELHVIVIANR